MKYVAVIFVLCWYNFNVSAQKNKRYTVNPGQKIFEVIPQSDIYKYPEFTVGMVLIKDGTFASAKLNYNGLLGEMQFIDPRGDTLSLADEKNISSYLHQNTVNFNDEGDLKKLCSFYKNYK